MPKLKRISISLAPDMLSFIDSICEKANEGDDHERLTRSRFISMCVLYFTRAQAQEQAENNRKEN